MVELGSTRRTTLIRAVALFAALVSMALVVRSLLMTYVLARPVPFWDQWEFERSIPQILNHTYTLEQLFSRHNEHRIFTSRIIYILDIFIADGSGYFCTVVLFIALAGIASVLAVATTGSPRLRCLFAAMYFGLLCSPAEWENLASGFQVQFPFVDLFFIVSLFLLLTSEKVSSLKSSALLLSAATFLDFLSVFSMANGVLAIIPLLFTRFYGGIKSRVFWLFIALHLLYTIALFWKYHFDNEIPKSYNLFLMTHYVFIYLGSCLRGIQHGPYLLGVLDFVFFLFSALTMLISVHRRRAVVDRKKILFLGIMLMMICNGYITAHGRASLGVETAAASRYSIQSMVFQIAMFGFVWQNAPRLSKILQSSLIAVFLCVSVASSFSPLSKMEWENRSSILQIAGAAMVNRVWSDYFLARIYPEPSTIHDALAFIAAHKLGPFSPTFGQSFEPAVNAIVGADLASLDTCISAFGIAPKFPDGMALEGWMFDQAKPAGNGHMVVFDETADHKIVGFGRQSVSRPDVDNALGVTIDRSGFDLALNLGPESEKLPHDLTIILIPEASYGPSCKVTRTVDLWGQ